MAEKENIFDGELKDLKTGSAWRLVALRNGEYAVASDRGVETFLSRTEAKKRLEVLRARHGFIW